MHIRRVTGADIAVLERLILFAGFPPDEPLPPNARAMPQVRGFLDGWGRGGDVGVLAVHESGAAIGAAWARLLDEPLLIDASGRPVPELAIAVEPDSRGAGVGTLLLGALCDAAAAAGHRELDVHGLPPANIHFDRELSLRASPRNPAVRLYRRLGFEVARVDERRVVMRRACGPSHPPPEGRSSAIFLDSWTGEK